jgi:hypothetical protein
MTIGSGRAAYFDCDVTFGGKVYYVGYTTY